MKLCVGPVAGASAQAWTEWARETLEALRVAPAAPNVLPAEVLDTVGSYLDTWADSARLDADGAFRWGADLPADELVYLTNSLYNLDQCLADQTGCRPGQAKPTEARAFHDVLVEALLFALTQEGRSEAAFVDHLRPWWPEAS